MVVISEIKAREILDSRGNPTVECEVRLSDGAVGVFGVPSGASTGEREALERRDGDSRFCGKGVLMAVKSVNEELAVALAGKNPLKQDEIDKVIKQVDGTSNKSRLGANATLAVSIAVCKAAASSKGMELFAYLNEIAGGCKMCLPVPMFNVINGGAHADDGIDIQEYMIVPVSAKTFAEAYRMGAEVFANLKKILKGKGLSCGVGDEGGFAPKLDSNEEPLKLIAQAVKGAGYVLGKDVFLALDVAGSEFFDKKTGVYNLSKSGEGVKTSKQLIKFYKKIMDKYAVFSIEDPFDQNDKDAFAEFTKCFGGKLQIVGDDLFVTNKELLSEGVRLNLANSVIIKPNQIGTLSETIDAVKFAKKHKLQCIISHRSGETVDSFISDFAVGLGAGEMKSGSLSRGERVEKYNRLLRIEEKSGGKIKIFSLKNKLN